jgi:predicted PurR-regulated permease PerM
VALVVIGLWSVLGAVAWGVGWQMASFARELPQYRVQRRARVAELRKATRDPDMTGLQATLEEVLAEIRPGAGPPAAVVVQSPPEPFIALSTIGTVLGRAGLVTLLLVFMLLERQELRNRVIRLVGHTRLAMTTRAMDEASRRISRYLLSQAILNASFGVGVGLGLFALRVPYALAWGVLAGVLRFIPFAGFWAALAATTLFAVATSDGWLQPGLTAALFLGLALALTFGLEPLLYGQSAGVSRVALLVGIALWTWLWGPAGLVIATPLTVCLIVLGRHVPELQYITVLIGDEPVLSPPLRLYQRLLAGDQEEATDLIEGHLASGSSDTVYDDLLLPALSAAKADRLQETLSEADERMVLRATSRIVLELEAAEAAQDAPTGISVLAFPVHDGFDELALRMLKQVLAPLADLEIASPELLSAEAVALAAQRRAQIVVVGSLQPGGHARLRYLCKRLRRDLPLVKIAAGAFAEGGGTESPRGALLAAGADAVVSSLVEARSQLLPWIQFVQNAPASPGQQPEPRVA